LTQTGDGGKRKKRNTTGKADREGGLNNGDKVKGVMLMAKREKKVESEKWNTG